MLFISVMSFKMYSSSQERTRHSLLFVFLDTLKFILYISGAGLNHLVGLIRPAGHRFDTPLNMETRLIEQTPDTNLKPDGFHSAAGGMD